MVMIVISVKQNTGKLQKSAENVSADTAQRGFPAAWTLYSCLPVTHSFCRDESAASDNGKQGSLPGCGISAGRLPRVGFSG